MFKIEKNVPVSTRARTMFPFHEMDVGDSFAVPHEGDVYRVQSRVSNSAKNHLGVGNYKTARDGVFIRVWRTA